MTGVVIAKFYSSVSENRFDRERKLKNIQRKLAEIEKREQENASADDQASVEQTDE